MTNAIRLPDKDPNDTNKAYQFIWCSLNGTNDGTLSDTGRLQSRTIASYTIVEGANNTTTKASDNKDAATVGGVSYSANTIVTIKVNGGTDGNQEYYTCRATLSDGEILDKTITFKVAEQ